MKKSFLFVILLFVTKLVGAQGYITAAGVRVGTQFGLTLQQRIADKMTIEGIVHSNFRNQTNLTVLIERHHSIIFKKLNYYAGAGIHKGWISDETKKDPLGVTGLLGLEMTISRVNISVDIKPTLNIVGGMKFFDLQPAVSMRYVFIPQKKQNIVEKIFGKKKRK